MQHETVLQVETCPSNDILRCSLRLFVGTTVLGNTASLKCWYTELVTIIWLMLWATQTWSNMWMWWVS